MHHSLTSMGVKVHVAYVAGKSARWYVKNMVGGYGDDAKRTDVNVVYANGTVKDYKWYHLPDIQR